MAIISERLKAIIKDQPNWYDDQEFIDLYSDHFKGGDGVELPDAVRETWEVISWFAHALAAHEVRLTDVKSGFNDDDRAGKFQGSAPTSVDTVVVHHTATKEDLTIWELEALGLLRLYLPHFMDKNPNGYIKFLLQTNPTLATEQRIAPASGHYVQRDGEEIQSFVGYHYIIYPDGQVINLLDKDHMGFHAGNLKVNIRSYGVAFVGNYDKKGPSRKAKRAFYKLMKELNTSDIQISYLDGHQHVKRNGHTECPGRWFNRFRNSKALSHLLPYSQAS